MPLYSKVPYSAFLKVSSKVKLSREKNVISHDASSSVAIHSKVTEHSFPSKLFPSGANKHYEKLLVGVINYCLLILS